MRVFLDVGSHDGQTLDEVLRPEHHFDMVYAFEPMPDQFAHLVARFGGTPNLRLCNYGLDGKVGQRFIYGSNDRMEASIYPTKTDVDSSISHWVDVVEASYEVGAFPDGDDITVKLNCEGAEVDILDNLIDSGEIWRIDNMLVDFDIRKVAGMEHREAEVRARLADIGFDRYTTEWPPGATHQERIRAWLE